MVTGNMHKSLVKFDRCDFQVMRMDRQTYSSQYFVISNKSDSE